MGSAWAASSQSVKVVQVVFDKTPTSLCVEFLWNRLGRLFQLLQQFRRDGEKVNPSESLDFSHL